MKIAVSSGKGGTGKTFIATNLAVLIQPAGYTPAVPFLLILAVLIVRPHGLFGEARA